MQKVLRAIKDRADDSFRYDWVIGPNASAIDKVYAIISLAMDGVRIFTEFLPGLLFDLAAYLTKYVYTAINKVLDLPESKISGAGKFFAVAGLSILFAPLALIATLSAGIFFLGKGITSSQDNVITMGITFRMAFKAQQYSEDNFFVKLARAVWITLQPLKKGSVQKDPAPKETDQQRLQRLTTEALKRVQYQSSLLKKAEQASESANKATVQGDFPLPEDKSENLTEPKDLVENDFEAYRFQ